MVAWKVKLLAALKVYVMVKIKADLKEVKMAALLAALLAA